VNTHSEIEKLVTWLRREAKQGAGLVSLTHQNVGGFGASIGKWPVAENDNDAVLVQLAQDLYRAACDDADGQNAPGPQQYIAHFFEEPDVRTPISRLPILVLSARQAALGPPGEGVATEPPTQSGFVAQVMRHSEFSQRHSWQVVGHALGMLERHAVTMSQENGRLQQHNFDLVRGYEDLLTERHIRELAAQSAMHDREVRAQFYNRLWSLAPAVLSKLGSGSSSPRSLPASSNASPVDSPGQVPTPEAMATVPRADETPLATQLRAFFGMITDEQLASLQSTLSPEQFIALAGIWSALEREQNESAAPGPAP
jgi:hypothetical protein